MTAINVVRFRVKPGSEQRFIDAHRTLRPNFKGFLGGNLVKTGDQTFCMLGEWRDFASLAGARTEMIAILDSVREMLDDLGGGLGVTHRLRRGRREARGIQTSREEGGEEARRECREKRVETKSKAKRALDQETLAKTDLLRWPSRHCAIALPRSAQR